MMVSMLDELYRAPPEEFTALRARLAAEAKKRGDTAAAAELKAARKPTTAAWVVNSLVHQDPGVRDRLRELTGALRDAHAAMDGEQIRALSARQRALVGELTTQALRSAQLSRPSAALRDDVTSTLQAAIADPEVADRLGTLVKAEQWSGFGVGVSTAKAPPPKKSPPSAPAPAESAPPKKPDPPDHRRREREQARAQMTEARQTKKDADEHLRRRHTELAAARTAHDEAQRRLRAAEAALQDAERAYADAEAAGLAAAARIEELRERLDELRR
jgi:hypothetical protein